IGVLVIILAAGAKPNLPLLFINAVHAAHDPIALRDLILDSAFLRIDQIEMPPAVALGSEDDLVGLLQPVDEIQPQVLRVGGPDERRAPLVDQVANHSRASVHADDAKSLM